jgi:hypothetical protein
MMRLMDGWDEFESHLATKARVELERYLWETAVIADNGLTLRSFLESELEVLGVDALDFAPLVSLITGLTPIGVLDLMARFREFTGGDAQPAAGV